MTISQILTRAKSETGVTDDDAIAFLLDCALAELYVYGNHLLFEAHFDVQPNPTGSASAIFTLPWYIRHVRSVRPVYGDHSLELNTPAPSFHDCTWEEAGANWVEVGHTPLDVSLTKPSKLVFKPYGPAAIDVAIAVAGPTTYASVGSESFTCTSEYTTINCYADVVSITKSIKTDNDIKVYDEAGTQVSVLPNFLLESPRIKIRTSFIGTTAVLYEPYLVSIPHAQVPEPLDFAIIWKIRELAKMETIFEEDPTIFTQKAQLLNRGATEVRNLGKVIRPNRIHAAPSYQGLI